MKTKLLEIVCLFLIIVSCDRPNLTMYEEGSGIYFSTFEMMFDTISVPWGLKNSDVTQQTITLEVKLIGEVKNYDRKFTITIDKEADSELQAKEGIDYVGFPTEYVIPKGAASAFIKIDLLRNPELLESRRHLSISLNETDELKFIYTRKLPILDSEPRNLDTQRVLKITEDFPTPRWWSLHGNNYFGKWSATKSILICDLMDIDRELWVSQLYSTDNFTEGFLRYTGVFVHRWLQEQDPKVLDEDGKPMEMGPYSKR